MGEALPYNSDTASGKVLEKELGAPCFCSGFHFVILALMITWPSLTLILLILTREVSKPPSSSDSTLLFKASSTNVRNRGRLEEGDW